MPAHALTALDPSVLDHSVLDTSVLSGALPATISLLGAAAFCALIVGRSRRWWTRTVPLLAAGSALLLAVTNIALLIWRPFPDPLPLRILFWAGVGVLAVALATTHLRARDRPARGHHRAIAVLLAALLVLTLAAMKINAFYGYRPTLGATLGVTSDRETDFSALAGSRPTVEQPAHVPLAQLWRPPANLTSQGRLAWVTITGQRSGFRARPAAVFVPPAYLASPRPLLPVLVLIAGQPGGPKDWLVAGRLTTVINTFAAAHGGLAPIVVVPDATGSELGNPMCLDSNLAHAETYLAEDVPNWIRANLQVDTDPRHWIIGGFSYGGTCALQLAVRRPATYPTFLDISGQQEPTLGNHQRTVRTAYAGDETKFQDVNPLSILAHSRFTDTMGVLAVGATDSTYGPQAQRVAAAAAQAGIGVHLLTRPGSHSWVVATDALQTALPMLATHVNLIAAPNGPPRNDPPAAPPTTRTPARGPPIGGPPRPNR
jgi:S-formylglutathione hydrolase FrmB